MCSKTIGDYQKSNMNKCSISLKWVDAAQKWELKQS